MSAPTSLRHLAALISIGVIGAACYTESPFVQLAHARELSANLLVRFVTATDAANKAVMSDNDDASARFAQEAQQAKEAIQADITSLHIVLRDLGYTPEAERLRTFERCFAEYRELDAQVLALVVENTNRRAQRLSFGPAQMEQRMAAAEAETRSALRALAPLVSVASRSTLETANAALNRFMTMHAQITEFSRRNTNVRSLALTVDEKGRATGSCEDSLRALRDALAKRELTAATR